MLKSFNGPTKLSILCNIQALNWLSIPILAESVSNLVKGWLMYSLYALIDFWMSKVYASKCSPFYKNWLNFHIRLLVWFEFYLCIVWDNNLRHFSCFVFFHGWVIWSSVFSMEFPHIIMQFIVNYCNWYQMLLFYLGTYYLNLCFWVWSISCNIVHTNNVIIAAKWLTG